MMKDTVPIIMIVKVEKMLNRNNQQLKNKTEIKKKVFAEKTGLHGRNKHRLRYDFNALRASCKELEAFVFVNAFNDESIDFSNPQAVKTLNQALLTHFYDIRFWDLPAGYLCPPIPGRADYIHYMADLLATSNNGLIPKGQSVKVLDIGVGANCVYPLIGNSEYGWRFVGSDVDAFAIDAANKIINANNLNEVIECRLQKDKASIFKGIIKTGEHFDLTICNPPFHASLAEAQAGTKRKADNLGYKKAARQIKNFGGQNNELWTAGGEAAFVRQMIAESKSFASSVKWFSTLVSKKENLPGIYYQLKIAGASDVETIPMTQGQKVSRVVAWRFGGR